MFRIALKPEVIAHGQYLVKNTNYGNRGVDDGDKHDQQNGIVAQCAIMDLMGYELPEVSHEADGGIDIVYDGIKIDVKTIACKNYPTPRYSASVMAKQKHYQTDIYIFSMVHREDKMVTVTGWMDKADFFRNAKLRNKGDYINEYLPCLRSTDYELKIAQLNQVDSLADLIKGLDDYF